ncbi:hypothetical protein GCM10009116_13860 [Brevundimonas basaltis]
MVAGRDDRGRDPRYGTVNIAVRWNADPGSSLMKRLFTLVAITSAVALTACDDPRPAEPEVMDMPIEEPVAPAVEDVQAPVVAPSATDTPPDNSRSPTDKRTSEESVQPNSETLFY